MPNSASAADVGLLITDAQIAGLSMAVIRKGGIETLTAAGVRNARDGAPIDQQTIFDAASLSKPVFAYAVLQLIDARALTLDTPLALCAGLCSRRSARVRNNGTSRSQPQLWPTELALRRSAAQDLFSAGRALQLLWGGLCLAATCR
jgi:hypothetical protein